MDRLVSTITQCRKNHREEFQDTEGPLQLYSAEEVGRQLEKLVLNKESGSDDLSIEAVNILGQKNKYNSFRSRGASLPNLRINGFFSFFYKKKFPLFFSFKRERKTLPSVAIFR